MNGHSKRIEMWSGVFRVLLLCVAVCCCVYRHRLNWGVPYTNLIAHVKTCWILLLCLALILFPVSECLHKHTCSPQIQSQPILELIYLAERIVFRIWTHLRFHLRQFHRIGMSRWFCCCCVYRLNEKQNRRSNGMKQKWSDRKKSYLFDLFIIIERDHIRKDSISNSRAGVTFPTSIHFQLRFCLLSKTPASAANVHFYARASIDQKAKSYKAPGNN